MKLSSIIQESVQMVIRNKSYRVDQGMTAINNKDVVHSEHTIGDESLTQICLAVNGINDEHLFKEQLITTNQSLLESFFLLLMDIKQSKQLKSTEKDQQLTDEITAYLETHYHQPLSLDDPAKEFCISKFYLEKKFKKDTHLPLENMSRRYVLVSSNTC